MKRVTVFFDMEAQWEQPGKTVFDERAIVRNIARVLDRHNAVAVFNTCGKVMEDYPDLIRMLDKAGHEISSHGYMHENFDQLSEQDANKVLEKTEKLCYRITKKQLVGFRPPWLFRNNSIYGILRGRGYKWISSEYSPFPELFSRPDKGFGLINAAARSVFGMKRRIAKTHPYIVNGITEIPLSSSMDGDLLSLVSPTQPSGQKWISFAASTLKKQYDHSRNYFNLNFHPWLIGSSNRLAVLDEVLAHLAKTAPKFVTARDLTNG